MPLTFRPLNGAIHASDGTDVVSLHPDDVEPLLELVAVNAQPEHLERWISILDAAVPSSVEPDVVTDHEPAADVYGEDLLRGAHPGEPALPEAPISIVDARGVPLTPEQLRALREDVEPEPTVTVDELIRRKRAAEGREEAPFLPDPISIDDAEPEPAPRWQDPNPKPPAVQWPLSGHGEVTPAVPTYVGILEQAASLILQATAEIRQQQR